MPADSPIAVYGASGHTGRFVIAELQRRGLPLVAAGRSAVPGEVPIRQATVDDPAALDQAFAGCSVVINCAGPFMDTARPVVEAAMRSGSAYVDVTAEQASTASILDRDADARAAGVAVVPAAGFYGGLADLLATALAGDGPVDEIVTGIALSHWWPTAGTRVTGERNRVPRQVVIDGRLAPMPLPAANSTWAFDAPFGEQAMVELPFSEIMTLAHHLPARSIRSHLNARALDQIRDPATPGPTAVDEDGRSAQQFVMETVVSGPQGHRRARARGRDIYAVSAVMLAEAAARLRDGSATGRGALSMGQLVDPRDLLAALGPGNLTVELDAPPAR